MVTLRPADLTDAPFLWDLANEPSVRWASGDRALIPWPEHLAWVEDVLADERRFLWVAESGGEDVGQIREDWRANGAWLSLAVAAEARGRGLGKAMIRRVLAQPSFPGPYRARVLQENRASLTAFAANGFHVEQTEGGWCVLVR